MATDTTQSVLGEGEATASGMPQLDFSTFPNQIFWLLLALVSIYFVLTRLALPRISGVLAERQGTITNDIAAAEELKLKAGEAEKSYDKALADARAEANRIAEENRAEMQGELDAAMKRADAEISAQQQESEARIAEIRDSAMANVEQVAKETARALVEALGGNPEAANIDAKVETRVKGQAS
ncbi:F0F1 ATP synthase subunit B' [Palleronia sediminis]|uniref:ATP synthase subunit b n=1 Tax=Palleronia sediminis TaxID=2547833 RepID=A0A4R6ACZ4_9RHOB|nr:F0F1 ATP synthase subunit B' [Palleronia sediminis]TDL81881.1 F0F1 ATP synthase subunit B' [Palleronia sediminis]